MAEKGRGFAAMDQQKQREIASRGGRAAHRRGTAHQFTAEEAAVAGRKGGQSVSRNREHMAQIGRKGGLATHHRQQPPYPDEGAAPGEHKRNGERAPAEAANGQRTLSAAQNREGEQRQELPPDAARVF